MEIDGRRIRVDYSITQRAHTPTPGIYMGKPTQYVELSHYFILMGLRTNYISLLKVKKNLNQVTQLAYYELFSVAPKKFFFKHPTKKLLTKSLYMWVS